MAVTGIWGATRPLDRVIILVLFLGALAGLWWSMQGGVGSRLVVEQDGEVIYVAPLGRDAKAEIEGPLGNTVVEVRNGYARVTGASCPERLCMAMGEIGRRGEVVACLPNRVLLRIDGEQEDKRYDLITR